MLYAPIVSAPGYEADDQGHIWSVQTNWRGYGRRRMTERPNKDGYPTVRVTINGKERNRSVHCLIAEAFHGSTHRSRFVLPTEGAVQCTTLIAGRGFWRMLCACPCPSRPEDRWDCGHGRDRKG